MPEVITDAATDPRWERLTTTQPTSVFHCQRWLRVLTDTYGFRVRAHVLGDTNGPDAGLAYVDVQDILDRRIVSLPFSDFCDPLAATTRQWHALVDDLIDQRCRMHLRCLHNTTPVDDDRFTVVDRALWHAIDVQRDEDEIWRALPGPARRALRKAHSQDVTVRIAEDEADLRAFFDLHLRVRKHKYGLLAQPYAFFANIWKQFLSSDHGALILAVTDGRVIGGCLFLEWQDVLYYKFNASDHQHLTSRPNDRVLWEGIRYAQKRGLQRIDLGLTDTEQDGLVRYKRKYATDEKTITLLRHDPPGHPSARDDQARALLRDMTRLLADASVPDAVTAQAGDVLYRYFV
jgi:CelD/BcsL family acetyltransferase involved in cellulose biosynthesis